MELEFTGELWFWRGPSPWHYVTVPDDESSAIESIANEVTYGWGVVPVHVQVGDTSWRTSLFPKDGRYLVPVKAAVRAAEGLELGDVVTVALTVDI